MLNAAKKFISLLENDYKKYISNLANNKKINEKYMSNKLFSFIPECVSKNSPLTLLIDYLVLVKLIFLNSYSEEFKKFAGKISKTNEK